MKDIFCDENVLFNVDVLNCKAILREDKARQEIEIGGIPEGAVLIKLDVDKKNYRQKSFYLRRGEAFLHKGCDYCLICPSLRRIFFFEMKSKKPKGYINQFVASRIFVKYCLELWGYKNGQCAGKEYEYINVLFCSKETYQPASNSKVLRFSYKDQCGREIIVLSPGFPPKIKLAKLYAQIAK